MGIINDSEYIISSIFEGCNCGGRRRPVIPVRTVRKPPQPIKIVPKRRKLYEKFTQESDPIRDMNIGIIKFWKEEYEKQRDITAPENAQNLFGDEKYYQEAFIIFNILRIIVNNNIFNDSEIQQIVNTLIGQHTLNSKKKININKMIKVLNDNFHMNVTYKGKNKQDVNEKFTQDSDPIIDMGIGEINYYFNIKQSPGNMYYFKEKGPKYIEKNRPTTYIYSKNKGNVYRKHPNQYAQQELRSNSRAFNKGNPNKMAIPNDLIAAQNYILQHYFKRKERLKESLNEKFSEEGDPIHDMGIGLEGIWDTLCRGMVFELKKDIPTLGSMYKKGAIIEIIGIGKGYNENYPKRIIYNLFLNKTDYDKKNIVVNQSWGWSFNFMKNFFKFIGKKSVNEKFTEESDPIEDMRIGQVHWFDVITEIFTKEYFDSEEDANAYIEIAFDNLEELFGLGLSEEEAADICYNNNPGFLEELDKLTNGVYQQDPRDDLKANCRSYEDNNTVEDAENLANYLINRHSQSYDEDTLRQMAYDWTGYDPNKDVDESISEKFIEGGDPIKDMGIGMISVELDCASNVKKKGGKWVIKPSDLNYHDPAADRLLAFLQEYDISYKVIHAHGPAGNWPIIEFTGTKKAIIKMLKELWEMDNEDIQWMLYGDEKNNKNNESISEKFYEEGDPIRDMGIGVRATFDSLESGDVLKIIKTLVINGSREYTYPKNSYIRIYDIEHNKQEHKIEVYHTHYLSKENLLNDKLDTTRDDVFWIISFEFFKQYFKKVSSQELSMSSL